jgi:hypothetical protein
MSIMRNLWITFLDDDVGVRPDARVLSRVCATSTPLPATTSNSKMLVDGKERHSHAVSNSRKWQGAGPLARPTPSSRAPVDHAGIYPPLPDEEMNAIGW